MSRDTNAPNVQQPPTEPILRIETGMHTAIIRRISVDAANRFLVTGSDDKTVRLWELATGRLLNILRSPIGEGNEGKLFAVAISPDGKTIAAGGWTGYEWDKHFSIYLFERETGRLFHHISRLPSVVSHLTFSPDGNRLAGALGVKGIRVYRTNDWQEVGSDTDYGDRSPGLDFDRAGRLVTSCYDGFLRLYDGQMKLIAKQAGPGGKLPLSVKFSPDGSKIAVGYDYSTKVDVISASNSAGLLKPLFSPDTTSVDKGTLASVAWSSDGSALFAGGQYVKSGVRQIRRWSDSGRGSFEDCPASSNTVADLISLSDGGVAFGAADSSWGIFTASGQRTRFVEGEIADFRDLLKGFQIDESGSRIRFAYESAGRSPVEFNLKERRLELNPAADSRLLSPRTQATGIVIDGWCNTDEPKLNGAKLALNQYEFSRSVAIASDGQKFLLGTEWNLRLYDRSGKQLWNVAAPGIAWSVNISGDGRLGVATFADGTIRWYRMNDGKEMLALFPHRDKKRWVIWTPSGYYDASPGGEDLIGWHVNQGKDQAADFHPASRFRNVAYRPDVIDLVLTKLDEAAAVAQANEEVGRKQPQLDIAGMLPPVVSILSPADGAEVALPGITISYIVRSPSGAEVTGIKALIDGRPVSIDEGRSSQEPVEADRIHKLQISVPRQDCEVALIAENKHTSSEPAISRLYWRGPAPIDDLKPTLFVLSIGVSRYQHAAINKLSFSAKDARDFADALMRQSGGLYRDVVVKVLADEQATRDEILDGLDWIEMQTTSRDVAMVFLSGHGINDRVGRYFFLTVNADPDRFRRTAIPFSDIKTTVETLAGKVLFFVDTCHSGNVLGSKGTQPDIVAFVNELASAENGAVVFASSTGKQLSLENAAWNNGAFTKALVEGIDGKADISGNGKITVNALDYYISERVKDLTRGRQTPTTTKPKTIQDFPVALKR